MIQIDKTMPKDCYDCPCTNDGFYICLLADKQLEDDCEDSRPTWCPLHEVTDADTISRRQAIDALFEILDRPKHAEFLYTDEIHRVLSNLPPSPSRPKGYWTNITVSVSGDSTADCNRCGATVHNSFTDAINFCPCCGTDMRPLADSRWGNVDEM